MDILLNIVRRERSAQFTFIFLIFLSFWWIFIYLNRTTDAPMNHIFGFIYGGFSVWGGIWGVITARKWGGLRSIMGRAIYCLAFGLLLQAFGQYSFWYYNYFLRIAVPYPSVPDIGYFGTIPFYTYASFLLAKISGVKVSLQSFVSKLQAIIIPLGILTIGYYLFLRDYDFTAVTPLQIFFDFGYPLGQAFYISIAILTYSLSRNILGGIMKNRILFLILAFFMQFLADYIFIYFHDLYFPASFIDYFYLLAYATMTLAIIELKTVLDKVK